MPRTVDGQQKMINNELLIRLATAIHGPHWQNATARNLGVNVRQIHRWKTGEYEVPDGVIADLVESVAAKMDGLRDALAAVERAKHGRSSHPLDR